MASTEPSDPSVPEEFPLGFVVGYQRSGTTFFTVQLGKFDGVVSPPETHYLAQEFATSWRRGAKLDRAEARADLAASVRLRDLDLDLDGIAQGLPAGGASRPDIFRHAMASYARAHDARFVIEKTPLNSFYIPLLMEEFPRSRFLAIVRDARDCILSLEQTPWRRHPAWRNALEWAVVNRAIRSMQKRAPERLRAVRYEDMLGFSDEQVRELAQWLFPAEQKLEKSAATAVQAIPEWERGWKAKAADGADLTNTAKWRTAADGGLVRKVELLTASELARWNYPVQGPLWPSRLAMFLWQPAFATLRALWRLRSLVRGHSRSV